MESVLLSVHVVAGILFVGPVAVVTSLFPRYAPVAVSGGETADDRDGGIARVLYRITRVYGTLALIVPAVGLIVAAVEGRSTGGWVIAAMILTAIAGGLLALQIIPLQRETLDHPDDGRRLRRIGMFTGFFNLLWVAVVLLMIVRPGAA